MVLTIATLLFLQMRFTLVIIQRSKREFMTFMQVHIDICIYTYIHYPPHILHLQIVRAGHHFSKRLAMNFTERVFI